MRKIDDIFMKLKKISTSANFLEILNPDPGAEFKGIRIRTLICIDFFRFEQEDSVKC